MVQRLHGSAFCHDHACSSAQFFMLVCLSGRMLSRPPLMPRTLKSLATPFLWLTLTGKMSYKKCRNLSNINFKNDGVTGFYI